MSVTIAELDQFHEFARKRMENEGARPVQDLVALWEAQLCGLDELSEICRPLEAGLANTAMGHLRPAYLSARSSGCTLCS